MVLIASVPGHCLSFTFCFMISTNKRPNDENQLFLEDKTSFPGKCNIKLLDQVLAIKLMGKIKNWHSLGLPNYYFITRQQFLSQCGTQ